MMEILRGSDNLKSQPAYPVLTLGNYDGVHIGHRSIFKRVTDISVEKRGTSILYTFDPHPAKILAPELAPPLLQTPAQKYAAIAEAGIDILIVEPFTKKFAAVQPDEFFENIVIRRVGAKEIVVGYDFTFGFHRSGKIDDLERLADKNSIRVHVIDAVFMNESLVSSTHIRRLIAAGDLECANSMLGRPYSITGMVVKGRGIGSEIGFHTANLATTNELMPALGVYISTAILKDGKRLPSVTNIGYNPTFGGTELSIETHIINFNRSILGEEMELEFEKKIRREMTFESAGKLRQQIIEDVSKAREYHEKRIQK